MTGHLLNEPITAELTPAGRPGRLLWRDQPLPVLGVQAVWPVVAGHLYRVQVTMPGGDAAVAEIVGEADGPWRLRTLFLGPSPD